LAVPVSLQLQPTLVASRGEGAGRRDRHRRRRLVKGELRGARLEALAAALQPASDCPSCGKTAGGYDEREGWIEFHLWKNERTGEVLFAAVLCPDCARREGPRLSRLARGSPHLRFRLRRRIRHIPLNVRSWRTLMSHHPFPKSRLRCRPAMSHCVTRFRHVGAQVLLKTPANRPLWLPDAVSRA
jgi:hypothetical protein